MLHFGILEMDMTFQTPFFGVLVIFIHCVSGLVLPTPENLWVDVWDGEAAAHWSHPTNAPAGFRYNVEMAKYTDKWRTVDYCTGITHTECDLSSLIHEYDIGYKVKVQLVVGRNASAWKKEKFLPKASKLRPPLFTLSPTSSSLTVSVHQKPILLQLFPFGVIYNVYLEQGREDKKNVTALLKGEDPKTTFMSLQRGAVYCVSARVQARGSDSASAVSQKQCVLLPEKELYIIAVTSVSFLAVLAFLLIIAVILVCYLRGPEKTPAVLKSPMSGWLPLSVAEGTMEVVTDKGWVLSRSRPEGKDAFPVTSDIPKEMKREERWTSMDSGVSMEPNSAEVSRGHPHPERHEDSGCGSLSGSESSTSNQNEYPSTDETKTRAGMDNTAGRDCQLGLSSANLDKQDSVSPKAAVVGDNYRSQSPSAVLEPLLCHPVLAEAVSGYRAAAQACICSGAGQCTWCHEQALHAKEVVSHYRATCADHGQHRGKQDACRTGTFLSYPQNTLEDAFTVEDSKSTFIHLRETFPMLTTLAPQDINMNFSLSLCDVQMAAD